MLRMGPAGGRDAADDPVWAGGSVFRSGFGVACGEA
jgi:hypothetical protein